MDRSAGESSRGPCRDEDPGASSINSRRETEELHSENSSKDSRTKKFRGQHPRRQSAAGAQAGIFFESEFYLSAVPRLGSWTPEGQGFLGNASRPRVSRS